MDVVFTDAAEDDLGAIGDFIARDNAGRVVTFVRELVECCRRLVDAPRGFPLVPRYESSRVRRRPYGAYLIFYRVGGERIEILHVLHGARDFEPILFPGG